MIRINLAPQTAGGGSASPMMGEAPLLSAQELRSEILKRLLVLLIGPVALYFYEGQNIDAKSADLNAKNTQLTTLQAYNSKQANSVAEIKKFKEDEALIEARIAAVEKISKDRNREIRVMDLLQSVIPEKAWLTRVQIFPDRVNIQGLSLGDSEVSVFLDALTKSVFLIDVNLVSSSEVIKEGIPLRNFEISCLLERPE